jgi:predicted transcriptional regulator
MTYARSIPVPPGSRDTFTVRLTMYVSVRSEADAMAAIIQATTKDLRQEIHALAERLSSSATWCDVLEYARYRLAVQEGLAEARRGEFASDEEVRAMYAKLGIAL